MKPALLMIAFFSVLSVSAQNSKPVYASPPLSKKSIGKQFNRSGIAAALPHLSLDGKYILVDVFFQACGPCRASIPYLNNLADSSKFPQLQVVSIDPFPDDSATMDRFISHYKIKYPVVTGRQAYDIASLIKNRGYPFAFLMDPAGKIIAIEFGFSEEGFEAFERKLTEAKPKKEVTKVNEVIFMN